MMFGRNARAGVFHADFYAVRAWQAKPPALLQRRHGGDAALPEMGRRPQHHCAAARTVLQGIVEQIRGNLLNFLIVETECRYGRVNLRFEAHSFALKGLKPPLGKLIQAIAQIVLAQLQDKLAARSEEHTSELQSQSNLVCRLLLEK